MMARSPSRPIGGEITPGVAGSAPPRISSCPGHIAAFVSALAADAAAGITSQRITEMPRVLIDYNGTIYTVDRAVGRNAPNDRLDVLLVQFLLFFSINGRNYGEIPNWWEELGYGDFSPPPPLTV